MLGGLPLEVVEDARAVVAAVDRRRDEPGKRRGDALDDVDVDPHDLVLAGRLAAEGVDEGRVLDTADDLGHRVSRRRYRPARSSAGPRAAGAARLRSPRASSASPPSSRTRHA